MNIVAIIEKKRDGYALSEEEIFYVIAAYMEGLVEDYHISALLMAIYFNGMDENEVYFLCKAMIESGTTLNLSCLEGISADKHSTGGVGDKTTLVLGPLLAACGIEFAKISGRGLSYTGGTLDKLESIPGFKTHLDMETFFAQVKKIHIAIMGQSEDMVPADKKLYALRDVSGSVPSIPLIATSVMSKKIAAGADVILIDVKYGDGAFMHSKEEAEALARVMICLGERFNRHISVEITNMNEPLGYAIGNTIEVKEALACLRNEGPKDLELLCLTSCAHILHKAYPNISYDAAFQKAKFSLRNGSALHKFYDMVKAQGGDISWLLSNKMHVPAYSTYIKANQNGYINAISCKQLGLICCELGAGRKKVEDIIDHDAGIMLHKKCGSYVKKHDILCELYASFPIDDEIVAKVQTCFKIEDIYKKQESLIYKVF